MLLPRSPVPAGPGGGVPGGAHAAVRAAAAQPPHHGPGQTPLQAAREEGARVQVNMWGHRSAHSIRWVYTEYLVIGHWPSNRSILLEEMFEMRGQLTLN